MRNAVIIGRNAQTFLFFTLIGGPEILLSSFGKLYRAEEMNRYE